MTYYALRHRTPLFIERAKDQALPVDVRDGAGAAATVASGTISIKRPSGDVVSSTALAVSGAGVASYALLATSVPSTLEYAQDWSVVLQVTLTDGTVLDFVRDAHLVARAPRPVIDASDLLRRHSDLLSQYTLAQLQVFVDEAWDAIQWRLLGDGRYPQMVHTSWSFAEPHKALALANVYTDLQTYTSGAGKYSALAEGYEARFERLWGGLNWEVDRDEDGEPDAESEAAVPIIYLFNTGGWGS